MTESTDHPSHSERFTYRTKTALCIFIAISLVVGSGVLGYLGSNLFGEGQGSGLGRASAPTWWEVLFSILICLGGYEIYHRAPRRLRWLGAVLSIAASARYITWRLTYTLNFDTTANSIACVLLFAAEIYALLMLLLGHFQTVWPTKRETPRMPSGVRWPWVDVFITTYDEDVDLVRRTAIGCQAIDYPSKHVFILDDGNRPEMESLAVEVGVGYITRTDNEHAKAGNLNHAMGVTSSEFIAQFDADHVPVKSFLRETIPFFLWDKELAFVQTPHHFYNLDAYQRNLLIKNKVANEQDLFFRVIQPGNDRWNAAFFCGSNAVLKREALESIGGFATETVTEDAHTALRLHAKEWNSVYLNRNLAGGLAAESFGDIYSQRIRWGAGMCRILAVNNPLWTRGLSIAQRMCYLAASAFFFYGFPRQIYFLAPIVFMFCRVTPINANVISVLTYILPHLITAMLLTSAISRNIRHTFWSEVFEAAMAFPMSFATIWSALTRKRMPFKVTPKNLKSTGLEFNRGAMLPPMILLGCTLASIVIGLRGLETVNSIGGIVIMNLFWCFYNVLILSAAVISTIDRPQLRKDTRVPCFLPASISWTIKGHPVVTDAATVDLSEGGAHFLTRHPLPETVTLEIQIGTGAEQSTVRGETVRIHQPTDDDLFGISVRFLELATHQRHRLIRLMYTDPNRWNTPPDIDGGWASFVDLAGSSFRWMREKERPTLRRTHRVAIDRSAVLRVENRSHIARLSNLTENSACLEGRLPRWKRDTAIEVMLQLSSGVPLNLPGRIVRQDTDQLAITFDQLSRQQRIDLLWDLYVTPMLNDNRLSA